MTLPETDEMKIQRVDINCGSCHKHSDCAALERKYAGKLAELKGNWRQLFTPEGGRVGTPIRRCSHGIVDRHEQKFRDGKVLEIGCGPASELDLAFCERNNVAYWGLDPERPPRYHLPHTKARNLQNKLFLGAMRALGVKRLPRRNRRQRYILDFFPSPTLETEFFDVVYGNSTIEHWHEDVPDLEESVALYRKDILECHRILRPGGHLVMNCPMFVHGNNLFVYGRADLIEGLFDDRWSSVELERWRENHDDLLPYCPEHRKKVFQEELGIDLKNIWILNIVARK